MNKTILSNPVRSIAFFLTAVILACTFGFTVDGWHISAEENPPQNEQPPSEASPPVDKAPAEETLPPEDEPTEPEIYIPEFTDRLTGLEVSETEAEGTYLSFVMNPSLPCYGISSAEVLCQLPTEDGSRFLAFIPKNTDLWKIGSITNTRGYISNLSAYFGGLLVSLKSDDTVNYNQCDIENVFLNMSESNRYHYTEYAENVYTNKDLLLKGLEECEIVSSNSSYPPLPYKHHPFDQGPIAYDNSAIEIELPMTNNSTIKLKFDSKACAYSMYIGDESTIDQLNGKSLCFTNCFVLFADSLTYDNAESCQMVMDTIGSGRGYYFTNGSYTEINWTATTGGVMTFYSPDGEKLSVSRGNSYIAFVRSSKYTNVTIN